MAGGSWVTILAALPPPRCGGRAHGEVDQERLGEEATPTRAALAAAPASWIPTGSEGDVDRRAEAGDGAEPGAEPGAGACAAALDRQRHASPIPQPPSPQESPPPSALSLPRAWDDGAAAAAAAASAADCPAAGAGGYAHIGCRATGEWASAQQPASLWHTLPLHLRQQPGWLADSDSSTRIDRDSVPTAAGWGGWECEAAGRAEAGSGCGMELEDWLAVPSSDGGSSPDSLGLDSDGLPEPWPPSPTQHPALAGATGWRAADSGGGGGWGGGCGAWGCQCGGVGRCGADDDAGLAIVGVMVGGGERAGDCGGSDDSGDDDGGDGGGGGDCSGWWDEDCEMWEREEGGLWRG
jgi:hypothetical protein